MHIGFLTPEYPHSRTRPAAGIGTSVKNMVEALAENGVKISIFVYGQSIDEIFVEEEIKIHLIRQRKYPFLGWFAYRKFLQAYLNKFSTQDKIDAIEAPDWTGITAFMKLNCPLVIRMNGTDGYFCHLEKRPQKKKNYLFEKRALTGADYLLSVSHFTAVRTSEIFKLKKKIRVIPNSVDVSGFKNVQGESFPNRIVYFGSLIRKKGVLELAKIFSQVVVFMPEAELIIAGKDVRDNKSGSSTKELMIEILTPMARGNVTWLGQVDYEEIVSHVSSAQVVVLPSFAEALPMTWLEAMAMEKALVTSDIGWAKEIMVNGETGFMVDPKEHTEFAEKILWLLKNPGEAESMGIAARERVLEKFSTDVVVRQNILFYKMVLAGGQKEPVEV